MPPDDEHARDKGRGQRSVTAAIVRRIWWAFRYPDDGALYHEAGEGPVGEVSGTVSIECEMAQGHYSCERHVKACGATAERFKASAY